MCFNRKEINSLQLLIANQEQEIASLKQQISKLLGERSELKNRMEILSSSAPKTLVLSGKLPKKGNPAIGLTSQLKKFVKINNDTVTITIVK